MQLKHEPSPEQIKQEKIYKEMNVTDEEFELIQKHLGRLPNYTELGRLLLCGLNIGAIKVQNQILKKFPTSGPQVLQGPGEGQESLILVTIKRLFSKSRVITIHLLSNLLKVRRLGLEEFLVTFSQWVHDQLPYLTLTVW